MRRVDATRIAVELAGESPIIGGVGNSTFDLVPFDRPRNFYMWNSMAIRVSMRCAAEIGAVTRTGRSCRVPSNTDS